MPPPRTRVFITVDAECSEERLIGGRIRRPLGYAEMMWGRLNSSHELGIPMLVDLLRSRGFSATFFVETTCTRYFGEEGLADVVRFLTDARQDVQLHLHPNFERPEWRHANMAAPDDNIGRLSAEIQRRLIVNGIAILERCGAGRVTAFRAGNFGASDDTLCFLRENHLVVDSSYNAFSLGTDCEIRLDSIPNDLFIHPSGMWELPLSNVIQPGGGFRHLAVTALSSDEMRWSLEALAGAGARHITVLTHPEEFFIIDSVDPLRGRPNRINVQRLISLLDFLNEHPDVFEVATVGGLADTLNCSPKSLPVSGPHPRIGLGLWLRRQAEQAVKRLDMQRRRPSAVL